MTGSLALTLRIVEFILLFGVLVFLHEFGHYILCRLCKIEVEEFGFGFPPRMLKLFTYKGTEFTLNWLPFGAFVRPKGEADDSIADGMAASSPWARLGVLLGGPMMNLLVGIILFSMLFVQTGLPDTTTVQISEVVADTPAAMSGLRAGDIIRTVNDTPIQSMTDLSTIIHANLGKEITLRYQRSDQTLETKLVPRVNPPAGQGSMGIIMQNPTHTISYLQALPLGAQATYEQAKQLFLLPGRLIRGQIPAEQARVVGPVGMFTIYQSVRNHDEQVQAAPASAARTPAVGTLELMAILSVALGLTNLLPIPALDGGRIIFVLPELLFRKRIPQRYENIVHLVGFTALILLMVYITAQDIIHPIQMP